MAYLAERLPLAATFLGYTVAAAPEALLARLVGAAPGTALRGFLRFAPGPAPEGAEQADYRPALRRCVRLTTGMPDFRPLAVNGAFFGNRGATATQQIAFSLNTAAALLAELPDADTTAAEVAAALHLHLAIGPSYFPEMAKLRAVRRLWATLLHAFGLPAELSAGLRIHASHSFLDADHPGPAHQPAAPHHGGHERRAGRGRFAERWPPSTACLPRPTSFRAGWRATSRCCCARKRAWARCRTRPPAPTSSKP